MRRSDGTSMADPLQVRMLRSDVDAWNRWRAENPTVRVDLRDPLEPPAHWSAR